MAEVACAAPAAYRPRRARESPLYRLAEMHHETFKQVYDERFAERYGAWRAVVERTLFAFLDCGIEERGFTLKLILLFSYSDRLTTERPPGKQENRLWCTRCGPGWWA